VENGEEKKVVMTATITVGLYETLVRYELRGNHEAIQDCPAGSMRIIEIKKGPTS